MRIRKLIHRKPKKRVLIIHQAGRLRHALAEGWMKAGWEVFQAEGRADGMPLMFELHPDLINLEVVTGRNDSWDALYSIRLLTSTPVVILTDGPPPANDVIIENIKLIDTSSPVSASKVITMSKALWKSAGKPCSQMTESAKEKTIVPTT